MTEEKLIFKDIIETLLNTIGYTNSNLWSISRNISIEKAIEELEYAKSFNMINKVLLIEDKNYRFITEFSIGDKISLIDYDFIVDEDDDQYLEITEYNSREVYIVNKSTIENFNNLVIGIDKALKEFCKGYIFNYDK